MVVALQRKGGEEVGGQQVGPCVRCVCVVFVDIVFVCASEVICVAYCMRFFVFVCSRDESACWVLYVYTICCVYHAIVCQIPKTNQRKPHAALI